MNAGYYEVASKTEIVSSDAYPLFKENRKGGEVPRHRCLPSLDAVNPASHSRWIRRRRAAKDAHSLLSATSAAPLLI